MQWSVANNCEVLLESCECISSDLKKRQAMLHVNMCGWSYRRRYCCKLDGRSLEVCYVFCVPVSQVVLFVSTLFLFPQQNILVEFKIHLFNTLTCIKALVQQINCRLKGSVQPQSNLLNKNFNKTLVYSHPKKATTV